MGLNLLHSIALTFICILMFLLIQMAIIKKFKGEIWILFIQYIVFVGMLLYIIGERKLIIGIVIMMFFPIILLLLSVLISVCIEKTESDVDIIKSFLDIFNIKLSKYYICIILSPVLEELFFRFYLAGIIFSKEVAIIRIVIPTMIFAISHLRPKVIIESFLGGLILSYIYICTYNMDLCQYIGHKKLNFFMQLR